MLTEKYKIEGEKHLFVAVYDDEQNILYNVNVSKVSDDALTVVNHGEINGKIKFNKDTIDSYVKLCPGGAFPIIVDKIGFVYSKSDLDARKELLSDTEYQEVISQYKNLITHNTGLGEHSRIFHVAKTYVNFDTGSQETIVELDNSLENWWSFNNTPQIETSSVFCSLEVDRFNDSLKDIIYLNPIERDIWNEIKVKRE